MLWRYSPCPRNAASRRGTLPARLIAPICEIFCEFFSVKTIQDAFFGHAALARQRTGSPWRDLPAAFGRWNTVFKRYRDWVKADVFVPLFEACSDEPDMEYALVDATIVTVHRHGKGSKGGLKARPSAAPKAT